MNKPLIHGAYSEDVTYDIEQIHYMAGGHPGCGGFCEALQIEICDVSIKFILHEYRSDCNGNRSRWCEYASREELIEAWESAWMMCHTGQGFGECQKKKTWWKA